MLKAPPSFDCFSVDKLEEGAFRDQLLIQLSKTAAEQKIFRCVYSKQLFLKPCLLFYKDPETQNLQVIGIIETNHSPDMPQPSARVPMDIEPIGLPGHPHEGNCILDFACYMPYLFLALNAESTPETSDDSQAPEESTITFVDSDEILEWMRHYFKQLSEQVKAHIKAPQNCLCPISMEIPESPLLHIRLGQIVSIYSHPHLLEFYRHTSGSSEISGLVSFKPSNVVNPGEDFFFPFMQFHHFLEQVHEAADQETDFSKTTDYLDAKEISTQWREHPSWGYLSSGLFSTWNLAFSPGAREKAHAGLRLLQLSDLYEPEDDALFAFLLSYLKRHTKEDLDTLAYYFAVGLIVDDAQLERIAERLPEEYSPRFTHAVLLSATHYNYGRLGTLNSNWVTSRLQQRELSITQLNETLLPPIEQVFSDAVSDAQAVLMLIKWLSDDTEEQASTYILSAIAARPHLRNEVLVHFLLENNLPIIRLLLSSELITPAIWHEALVTIDAKDSPHLASWLALLPNPEAVPEFYATTQNLNITAEQALLPGLESLHASGKLNGASVCRALLCFLDRLEPIGLDHALAHFLYTNNIIARLPYVAPLEIADIEFTEITPSTLKKKILAGDLITLSLLVLSKNPGVLSRTLSVAHLYPEAPLASMYIMALVALSLPVAKTITAIANSTDFDTVPTVKLTSPQVHTVLQQVFTDDIDSGDPRLPDRITALKLAIARCPKTNSTFARAFFGFPFALANAFLDNTEVPVGKILALLEHMPPSLLIDTHFDEWYEPEALPWLYHLSLRPHFKKALHMHLSRCVKLEPERFSDTQIILFNLLDYSHKKIHGPMDSAIPERLASVTTQQIIEHLALLTPIAGFTPPSINGPEWEAVRQSGIYPPEWRIRAAGLLFIAADCEHPRIELLNAIGFFELGNPLKHLLTFLKTFPTPTQHECAKRIEADFPHWDISVLIPRPRASWLPSFRQWRRQPALPHPETEQSDSPEPLRRGPHPTQ